MPRSVRRRASWRTCGARGDRALAAWTRKLDGIELDASGLWIHARNCAQQQETCQRRIYAAPSTHAAKNVRRVAEKQLPGDWTLDVEPGVQISQVVRPIESIGCYIPGGRFALVSTLMMTVVPAKVAGVKRIVVGLPSAQ